MTSRGDDMSEDNQLEKFRFSESFTVEFFVEAEDYQKAYSVYSKMFDKNIQLGYDTWKNLADKNIVGGKFHVKTMDKGEEATFIEELWGDIGEEE
tara:strand:- start:160 stop:444 length:285 start_codon:yes stop_codon:yes gene_type:complete